MKLNEGENIGAMETHGQQGISEKMSPGARRAGFQPRGRKEEA